MAVTMGPNSSMANYDDDVYHLFEFKFQLFLHSRQLNFEFYRS